MLAGAIPGNVTLEPVPLLLILVMLRQQSDPGRQQDIVIYEIVE